MKRLFFALLACTLVLAGCMGKGEKKISEEELPSGVMLKVGNSYVDSREGLTYLSAVSLDFAKYYGSDILDYRYSANGDTIEDKIRTEVLHSILRVKITCQKAEEMNICLSSEELEMVDKRTDEYMAKPENAELVKLGVTKDIVRRIYSDNYLARKVYEEVTRYIQEEYGGKIDDERLENVKKDHFDSLYVAWRAETEVLVNRKAWDGLEMIRQ